ncbi:MAG TPA: flagellar biosynthesis anti-sigma factor FlgM, partial [Phycisphaerae bacterium]|nr:flagellar biosynthesis anti-sigma factor FlgM [Phycisphaerae bacterium]
EINNLEGARLVYPFAATPGVTGRGEGERSGAAVAETAAVDRVEFSPTAVQLAEAAPTSQQALRLAKVARIRAEIQNGTYDVNGKLESVLHRVIADVLA